MGIRTHDNLNHALNNSLAVLNSGVVGLMEQLRVWAEDQEMLRQKF